MCRCSEAASPCRCRASKKQSSACASAATSTLYSSGPKPAEPGVVDIEVQPRDAWSLDPGFSASRSGEANNGGVRIREYKRLGSGTSLGVRRSRAPDRLSTALRFDNQNLLGNWFGRGLATARNSDGHRDSASVLCPRAD